MCAAAKRFQVFVSSTYEDLREERQEVIQALLELDCIPSGMELFPASDDDQWTLIKRVIDDCDYYVVVIGGRYGSVGPDGKSFTQLEYEYAVESRKPVLAFLHGCPERLRADRTERDPDSVPKLELFRRLAKQRMCRYWHTPQELGALVSRGMIQIIKQKPAIGWVRANAASPVRMFYRDNNHIHGAVIADHIVRRNIKRAWLVQFSAWNVLPILQELWRNTDAEISLYVMAPDSPYAVGDQKRRIGDFEKVLPRELSVTNTSAVLHYWQYAVPASPRIVSLDDDLIAVGPYLYEARDPKDKATIDAWGGEVPVLLVRNGDPDFDLVWRMVDSLIRNWSTAGLAEEKWSINEAQRRQRVHM